MDAKRQRGENFTRQDKELLLERVIERKDIVEMKKYDAASARAKEQAWRDIANNYNVLTSFPRTPGALKICWENMKRKCRKSYAMEVNAIKSGEKKHIFENDPLLEKVKDILNLSSDNYQNDSNALYDGSNSQNMASRVKEEQSTEFGDHKAITYGYASSNWSDCDPYRLKRPAADILGSSEKRIMVHQSSKTSPYIQTLTSETSDSDTQGHDETDTLVQDTNNYSPRSNNSKREDGRHFTGESSKTSPCVQRLTFETTSDVETPREDGRILRVNNSKNSVRWQPHIQHHQINSLSDLLTESKIELVRIAKEHALAEERRRNEIHNLQVEEMRLKLVEEKKIIALYQLRAQETELKIEVLKSKLENGFFD